MLDPVMTSTTDKILETEKRLELIRLEEKEKKINDYRGIANKLRSIKYLFGEVENEGQNQADKSTI